jgi:serine/threonine protein phosphatase 1
MTDSSTIVRFRSANRIWAVAAIHGEADRLARLHEALAPQFQPGDRLVYLGNYMGYGPTIVETIDHLLAFRRRFLAQPGRFSCDVAYLRGSQEEMWTRLAELQFAVNPGEVLNWMLERGVGVTLGAYGIDPDEARARARGGALELARFGTALRAAIDAHPGHRPFTQAVRRAAVTEHGELIFVHAGLDPAQPLDVQDDTLWWGGADFEAIAPPYGAALRLIRGAAPDHAGPRVTGFGASIDAGCGSDGPLRAVCFDLAGHIVERIEA